MAIQVRVQDVSPIEKRLTIEVDGARIAEELTRAYTTLGRQVQLPGFRPGKAPRRLLETHYRDRVQAEVRGEIMAQAYVEAIQEHKLEPMGDPRFENGSKDLEAPFTFTALIEIKPTIEPKDYFGVAVQERPVNVTDEQVSASLEELRSNSAKVLDVVDRKKVEAGDIAFVTLAVEAGGVPKPELSGQGLRIEAREEGDNKHLGARLIGLPVGEPTKLTGVAISPEKVEGGLVDVLVTVEKLQRRDLPALDDELAKQVGVPTLPELKELLKKRIADRATQAANNQRRDELFDRLIEKNAFEVPQVLVRRIIQNMLEAPLQDYLRAGGDIRKLPIDWKAMEEELRPRAVREAKGLLLLEAIAEKESVTASDEEVEAEVARIARQSGVPLAQVQREMNPQTRARIRSGLRSERTLALLLEKSVGTGAPAT